MSLPIGWVVFCAVMVLLVGACTGTTDATRAPRAIGSLRSLRERVTEEQPLYIRDAGGGKAIWLVRVGRPSEFYAVAASRIGRKGGKDCKVKWSGVSRAFTDCEGGSYPPGDLERYGLRIVDGSVFVDTGHTVPEPAVG